jgi:uncharacterized protein (DUF697 family)
MTETAEATPSPAEATDETVTAATTPPAETTDDAHEAALDSEDVIKNHVIAAMAVGLVPIPGVDMAGMVGVQVSMVHQICGIYGVTLRENAARAAVLSLVGGVLPATLATGFVSALKIIPGLGSLSGAAGASLLGGAMTYAVGQVFHQHLEKHGSLIDFNTTKARAAMRREFDNGVGYARSLRSKVTNMIVTKKKADTAEPASAEAATAHAATEAEPVAA